LKAARNGGFSFISNGFHHFCNSLQFTLYRDISQKHGQNVGTNHVSAMTAFLYLQSHFSFGETTHVGSNASVLSK